MSEKCPHCQHELTEKKILCEVPGDKGTGTGIMVCHNCGHTEKKQ